METGRRGRVAHRHREPRDCLQCQWGFPASLHTSLQKCQVSINSAMIDKTAYEWCYVFLEVDTSLLPALCRFNIVSLILVGSRSSIRPRKDLSPALTRYVL